MGDTAIEWATKTWEVTQGCTKVSPGCARCWAQRLAKGRLRRLYPSGFEAVGPIVRRILLREPLFWRIPQRIFVSSRSDFFHEAIPPSWQDKCFAVMFAASRHVFMLLTKRATTLAGYRPHYADGSEAPWPPNVWAGVSVEYQRWADVRVPLLLQSPAPVRWVSIEPILGPIDLRPWLSGLSWVVVGDESGKDHRPAELEWVRNLRDQCQETGVAFYFKQFHRGGKRGGKTVSLPILDGRQWTEFPHAP